MKKRILVALVTLPVAIVLLEGFASVVWFFVDYGTFRSGLRTAIAAPIDHHCTYDPELGWRNVPGKHIADIYGAGRSITINADGFRGGEDYVGRKAPDAYRVVCLGDSFTLGSGVDDADTYPAQLQRHAPGTQVVNMGQGGYSVGQAFLWFQREGRALEPDCLVFAFINDDIWRMSGTHSNAGYGIPSFELENRRLVVANVPVPERVPTGRPVASRGEVRGFLTDHSGIFRTLNEIGGPEAEEPHTIDAEERLAVGIAIFREVNRIAKELGIPLVLVQLPEHRQVFRPDLRANYLAIAERIRRVARNQGFHFVDLMPAFVKAGGRAEALFLSDDVWKHYSPAGNRLVAAQVAGYLREKVDGFPGE